MRGKEQQLDEAYGTTHQNQRGEGEERDVGEGHEPRKCSREPAVPDGTAAAKRRAPGK